MKKLFRGGGIVRKSLFVLIVLLAFVNVCVYANNDLVNEVINNINSKYFGEFSTTLLSDIKKIAIGDNEENIKVKEIIGLLDEHSFYYTKEDCDAFTRKDSVNAVDITSFVVNSNIYIKINSFTIGTDDRFKKILDDISEQNIAIIYLDLSNCSGGMTNVMENIAMQIVPKGIIYNAIFKNDTKTYYSQLKKMRYEIISITSNKTASSAEILVGALKDAKATKIIGDMTFGKATIQELIPLSNGGILKLTVGKYTTRNGTNIEKVGIKPDIFINRSSNNKSGGSFPNQNNSCYEWSKRYRANN